MTNADIQRLDSVPETMLIPLWARAVEAKQRSPILYDAKAVEMVNAIDYDFGKFVKGKASQVGCCLRASIIDGWVRQFLQEHPRGCIVEIGVGLDTRFERVDNNKATWFEVDLPDVIEVRRRFFEETQRRRFIGQSVLAWDWIPAVKQAYSRPFMFVAEGVFMYFEEKQVKELFAALAEEFPGSTLAFDAMSPLMLRMQKRHDTIRHMSAVFRWGIPRIKEIELWDSRYTITDSKNFADAAKNHRSRFPLLMRTLWRLWPSFRLAYGMHLARLGSTE